MEVYLLKKFCQLNRRQDVTYGMRQMRHKVKAQRNTRCLLEQLAPKEASSRFNTTALLTSLRNGVNSWQLAHRGRNPLTVVSLTATRNDRRIVKDEVCVLRQLYSFDSSFIGRCS